MRKRLCVDHIVDGWAFCEDEEGITYDIPLSQLPAGVKEQDWLLSENSTFTIDQDYTEQKKQENWNLFRRLLEE